MSSPLFSREAPSWEIGELGVAALGPGGGKGAACHNNWTERILGDKENKRQRLEHFQRKAYISSFAFLYILWFNKITYLYHSIFRQ
jgi:hypothetical protein